MLISLAWKNIWRNKKRSIIVVLAIMFGLWGGMFSGAMMIGMGESMVNTAIDRDISHIQIHNKGFLDKMEMQLTIPDQEKIIKNISRDINIEAVSGRMIFDAMVSSPKSAYGVKVTGVIPAIEQKVTRLHENIIEGSYFETKKRNPIVIGKKLAERLGVKIRSKIVLSFQGLDGEITYIACRIVGIYKTNSSLYDAMNVIVKNEDIYRILDTEPIIHEIAVRAVNAGFVPSVLTNIKTKVDDLVSDSWKEIAPDLAYIASSMSIFTYLFVAIIIMALIFGITNTMLMAVVDRTHEFGVLIAVGMKRAEIFMLIILETLFLSFTGAIGGVIFTVLTVSYFYSTGIDLSFIATSLESFGASSMVYPELPVDIYLVLTIMVIFAANIAAVLPALKVMRLNPSQAIRFF